MIYMKLYEKKEKNISNLENSEKIYSHPVIGHSCKAKNIFCIVAQFEKMFR